MAKTDQAYKSALAGKKIPILTLDNKWHQLFSRVDRTPELDRLEEKLNALMKRQGKLTTECKEIRALKKKLMDDVLPLAERIEREPERKYIRKMEEMRRLIQECGMKFEDYQQELQEIPAKIDETNTALMLETMRICYKVIQTNTDLIEKLNAWIEQTRAELRKNLVRREESEEQNYALYSYMNAIFGPEVSNVFDIRFSPERLREELEAVREEKIRKDK